ncbi:hypothetical protein [Actinoplanes sp. L3-i22]|uniref:hypothetical protein n=1 Tax=Actinoplanes sp. L3-i22 TaxID=2836373 RepID=UPI001C76044C|nr:hypothetical protein [Actinoplanes sp. L3-i22]BCY11099.1 hypothetical protein L3i22_061870 [Actinoplanes sp. L3-i22]
MTANVHPFQTVHVGTRRAEIDELLAPVIEAIWQHDLVTLTSCQDAGQSNADWVDVLPHMAGYVESRRGWAFIDFPQDDGLEFLTLLANAGPRDAFYTRMTHWAAPSAWDVKIRPRDVAMQDWPQPSRFTTTLLQVCFPVTDLPEMLRRLQAGQIVPPAPADWTTVGRSRPSPVTFPDTPPAPSTPVIRAVESTGDTWDDPDHNTLDRLIADLNLRWRHLVLERRDLPGGEHYLQIYLNDDHSFQVEFREGGADRHYRAYLPIEPEGDLEPLLDLVHAWSTDRPGWRDTLQWYPLTA